MLDMLRGGSMKKLIALLMIWLLPTAAATAQEVRPVPAEISTLADQVVDLVLRSIPRRVQRPVVIAVAGLQAEGRETQLGELFAMTTTSRLVNEQDSRITVLAGQHLEVIRRSGLLPAGYPDIETGLPPDYVVNGRVYLAADTLYVAVQVIHLPEAVVAGGIELAFPASDAMRDLLRSSVAQEEGWDPYEPDSQDQPGRLYPGESVSGHTIMPEGDEDWFLVEVEDLEGGGFMSVYTRGTTDTYMEVYGPDDPYMLLVENDDSEDNNPRVAFSVENGQKYWVKVRGYDGSTTGSYLIVAEIETYGEDPAEPNNSMEEASPLAVDEEWSSSLIIPVGDVDWYAIEIPASAGENLLLTVETGGEIDTYMDLYDENEALLMSDDDGGDETNARISMLIDRPGRYYARVVHFDDSGAGPYRIRAGIGRVPLDEYEPNNSVESATPIAVDEEVQSHIFVHAEDVDWLTFSLSSGGTVVIETGGDTDTVMALFDRAENLIAEDDDGGRDANARIQRYLPAGTYYVRIGQFQDNPRPGSVYTVSVTSGPVRPACYCLFHTLSLVDDLSSDDRVIHL